MAHIIYFFILFFGNDQYRFGEQISLNDLGNTEFFHLSDFKVIDDRIYIADIASSKVFLFDKEGNFINSSGRDGRGPGEFMMGPRQIVMAGDNIYVTGRMEPYFYVYDQDLNFLTNENFKENLISTYYLNQMNNKLLIVASYYLEDNLFIYDTYTKKTERINLNFKVVPGQLYRHNFFKIGENWLAAWYFQNKFKLYDNNFNLLTEFSLENIKDKADGIYRDDPVRPAGATQRQKEVHAAGIFSPAGSFFEEFVVIDNYHFMVQLGRQTGSSENAMIINLEGEIVQELVLPEQGRVLGYSHNTLYLVSSDEMHVVAYEFYR